MLCVSSMQGNCSLWSQYFANCHYRNAYAFLPRKGIAPFGRNILRIVTTETLRISSMQGNCSPWSQYFSNCHSRNAYAFLPCKGIAPFGRNILRIVTTEMLRISSVTILKFLSASAGAGVVAAYFGHCAHYGYVLTLPAALHC